MNMRVGAMAGIVLAVAGIAWVTLPFGIAIDVSPTQSEEIAVPADCRPAALSAWSTKDKGELLWARTVGTAQQGLATASGNTDAWCAGPARIRVAAATGMGAVGVALLVVSRAARSRRADVTAADS